MLPKSQAMSLERFNHLTGLRKMPGSVESHVLEEVRDSQLMIFFHEGTHLHKQAQAELILRMGIRQIRPTQTIFQCPVDNCRIPLNPIQLRRPWIGR